MATMSVLRERADELRQQRYTPHGVLRQLRNEFPWAERDFLINASRIVGYHRGVSPEWGRLRPVICRWQKKGRPVGAVTITERKVLHMDYPLMTTHAKDLRENDCIDGHGTIDELGVYRTMVYVKFSSGDDAFFSPLDHVVVRIEDHGLKS